MSNVAKASTTLTSVEVEGLTAPVSLADGHAYHEPCSELSSAYDDVKQIWKLGTRTGVRDAEFLFRNEFANLIAPNCKLSNYDSFSIAPTASCAIDIVSAWVNSRKLRLGLIEPTFDNLYLLLKRRGVSLVSLEEHLLVDTEQLRAFIRKQKLDGIFIVLPNNPTGTDLNCDQFVRLCKLCAEEDIVMILDKTFRFYSRQIIDEYAILDELGVSYVLIEDTGKTWPTQDLKVSLFAYSSDISIELRTLYEEVFLCHSNFALGLLTEIVRRTRQIGMERAVLNLVRTRKSVIREILHDSALHIEGSSSGAELPLLWIDCSEIGDDQHVADIFRRNGVVVLPGHHFYWQQHASMKNWIRLSLLRPAAVFADGVNAISQILEQLPNNKLNDVLNIPNWMRWAPYVGERLQFTTE